MLRIRLREKEKSFRKLIETNFSPSLNDFYSDTELALGFEVPGEMSACKTGTFIRKKAIGATGCCKNINIFSISGDSFFPLNILNKNH